MITFLNIVVKNMHNIKLTDCRGPGMGWKRILT